MKRSPGPGKSDCWPTRGVMRREEKEIHVTGKQKGWEREVVQDRGWCGEHDVLTGEAGHGHLWKWHNETDLATLT